MRRVIVVSTRPLVSAHLGVFGEAAILFFRVVHIGGIVAAGYVTDIGVRARTVSGEAWAPGSSAVGHRAGAWVVLGLWGWCAGRSAGRDPLGLAGCGLGATALLVRGHVGRDALAVLIVVEFATAGCGGVRFAFALDRNRERLVVVGVDDLRIGLAHIRATFSFQAGLACGTLAHGGWRWECGRPAEGADPFGGENGGAALLSLQVFLLRKETAGKLLGKAFSAVIGVAYWHIKNSPR